MNRRKRRQNVASRPTSKTERLQRLARLDCAQMLARFHWPVCDAGYRGEWLLSRGHVWSDTVPLTGTPKLVDRFAALTVSRDAILDFANAHGQLRSSISLVGEPLILWQREQQALRYVLDVLKLLRGPSLEKIFGKRLERRGDQGWWYSHDGDECCLITPASSAWEAFDSSKKTAPLLARLGHVYLARLVNKRLDQYVRYRELYDSGSDQFRLHVQPRHLLGALWLQCAPRLGRPYEWRVCAYCGTSFEISPEGRRRQSKYCKDNCRKAASKNPDKDKHQMQEERTR